MKSSAAVAGTGAFRFARNHEMAARDAPVTMPRVLPEATPRALPDAAPDLTPEAMREASRVRLSAHIDTAPEVLHTLATDTSVTVRASVALNPATSVETNETLAGDPDERVRALVARKLAALVPSLSAKAQTRLRQQTLATLTELAEDETLRVRAAIADAVKDMPEVPRAIILRLAHDDAVTVCEPVIRFSPLLTTDDLVSLVTAAPSPSTAIAVARRAAIDAAVSDAVASGGTDDAVLALLMNGSAQIREATLDALVERSIEHPDWQRLRWCTGPRCQIPRSGRCRGSSPTICWKYWPREAISIRSWPPNCVLACGLGFWSNRGRRKPKLRLRRKPIC